MKLRSLTIFFPFFNDEGTVKKAIDLAYEYGAQVTKDLEVIALHGGASQDNTYTEILKQKKRHRDLVVMNKADNWEGYAVIKYGLKASKKEWVFYTDGDLQYHVADLLKLVQMQEKTGADVVNGYKRQRGDKHRRVWAGKVYKWLSRLLFHLPIQDTDCDFRLIKRSFLRKITLESHNASLLPELIKKLQWAGATFAQIPVSHTKREYGKSNYSLRKLVKEKLLGDLALWWRLFIKREKGQKDMGKRQNSVGVV